MTALYNRFMRWVYVQSGVALTASIAVVGVEGLAVIFEFSMLAPSALPFILAGLALLHWYRSRDRAPLRVRRYTDPRAAAFLPRLG